MTPDKLDKFRRLLEELAAGLEAGLGLNPEETRTVELDSSIGRLSRMDALQGQQMALELKRRQQQRLQRVRNALQALESGRYGACRKCGQPIAEDRLEYQPDALLCVTCAEKH